MRRACRVTLKFSTAATRRRIRALIQEYRAAVNLFVRRLWNQPDIGLNKATLEKLPNLHLSQRYKSQCLKQALELIFATKKSAKALKKKCARPVFTGWPVLDAKFVGVEPGRKSFDLVLKVSTLKKGRRAVLPTRRTAVVNRWLDEPDARLVQGCELRNDSAIVWVEMPDPGTETASVAEADPSRVLGIDLGINKLIADSDGSVYGADCKDVLAEVNRHRPGTKARRRAMACRDQFIDETVNSLPWGSFDVLAMEDLKGIKTGKNKKRSRDFRRSVAPWTARRVKARVAQRCEENRVLLVTVAPAYTSRACPQCGCRDTGNRNGESFKCIGCGHAADADFVGALNVKRLGSGGSLESPQVKKDE